MIRRLLLLVIVGLVAWLIRSMRRSPPRPATRRPPTSTPEAGAAMVRDRVCNTYLPRERAVTLSRDGREYFFCSENCRSTFLARPKTPA